MRREQQLFYTERAKIILLTLMISFDIIMKVNEYIQSINDICSVLYISLIIEREIIVEICKGEKDGFNQI